MLYDETPQDFDDLEEEVEEATTGGSSIPEDFDLPPILEDLHAPWRRQATCLELASSQPELFGGAWDGPNDDKERHELASYAQSICVNDCPVRLQCLESALQNTAAQGLRGGYEFDKGRLPVAKAREIEHKLGLKVGDHQSLGRLKTPEKREEQ